MSRATREQVMTALCAAIDGLNLFAAPTGRRLQLWNQVTVQPACFVRNLGDDYDHPNTILPRLTMRAEIWLYSNSGKDPTVAPGIALNQIVDALEAAFAPDSPTGCCTLGGLVQWARLEGRSDFDPGDLDGQAKAVLPVSILVP